VRTLIRASLASVLSFFVFLGPVSAATNTATTLAQATQAGTITGQVVGDSASGLSGAQVLVEGSGQHQSTTTDNSGNFSVSVPPGLYTVTVVKAGYQTGSNDVTVIGGAPVTLNVTLTATTLSNLNVIGRTSSTGGASAARFNISSTPTRTLSQQQLTIRNTPDLTSILQELPGVTIPRATSNPNQSFLIHGLRYETKTEIDGHPISSGTGGTFLTNYTPAAIFGSVDVLTGGGLLGPTSGESGVGIVNLRTPDFTAKDSGFIQGGLDSYGGTQYTAVIDVNFLKDNKLSLILARDFSGYRGPTYGTQQADYTGATPAFGTGAPATLTNGIVQYIADFSDTYSLNGELAKMRYKFSDATSLTLEFLGLQGRFDPQGGAYGQYIGQLTVPTCINKNVAGNGAACNVTSEYNSPAAQGSIGQTIPIYGFYPGSDVRQNQPNFNLDFKTTIGNDTVLFRPYTAAINRLIDGTQENNVPGDNGGGWYQVTSSANCQANFVAAAAGVGAKGPCFAAGSSPVAAYIGGAANTSPVVYATTNTPLVCTATTPCYTTSTGLNNSGQVGYGSPYTTLELDKLAGYTFSYIHPFGSNTLNLSFDHYYDDTQAFVNDTSPLAAGCTFVLGSGVANTPGTPGYQAGCPLATLRPSPINVPETFTSVSSLALSGQFQLTSKLEFDAGGYFTHYLINGQQQNPGYLAAETPIYGAPSAAFPAGETGAIPVNLSGFQNSVSHFDPRSGLIFRPNKDLVFRFTAGSSMSIPYASLVSGFTTYAQGSTSTTVTAPNANLLPEELVTLDLGSDWRTPDGTVLSGDIYNTVVHNPWLNPHVQICNSQPTCAIALPGLEQTSAGYTSITVNGAQQYAQGVDFSITREPAVGFGYRVNTSFERLYYLDTPAAYLATPQVYFNGNQFVSTGSGNTSVPYAKGYGEIQYAGKNQSLIRFGADYEGNNNEYNAPAFWIFDAGARVNTGFHDVLLGVSVENLFNENFNALLGRGVEYAGLEPVTGTAAPGGYTYATGTYNTALVAPAPITFRFTLTKQF
jgi:hypothetical protein